MQAVAQCRHPTIATIRGACVGGGLEIAAMCDLRICGEASRFGVRAFLEKKKPEFRGG